MVPFFPGLDDKFLVLRTLEGPSIAPRSQTGFGPLLPLRFRAWKYIGWPWDKEANFNAGVQADVPGVDRPPKDEMLRTDQDHESRREQPASTSEDSGLERLVLAESSD